MLKVTGEAAVVLPDNVLFEGGAGEEILARDKTSLDIFWLKDQSLTDLDNLPDPDILANEIIENLESGLGCFREIMGTMNQASA